MKCNVKIILFILLGLGCFIFNEVKASGLKIVNPRDIQESMHKQQERVSNFAKQHTSTYPDLAVTGRVRVSKQNSYYCKIEVELKNKKGRIPQNEISSYMIFVTYSNGFRIGDAMPSQLANPGAVVWYKIPSDPLGFPPGDWNFTVEIAPPYKNGKPKDNNLSNNKKQIHASCNVSIDLAIVDIKARKTTYYGKCAPVAVVKNAGNLPLPYGLNGYIYFIDNYGYSYSGTKLPIKIHNPGQTMEIEGPGGAYFTGTKTFTIKLDTLPYQLGGRFKGYLEDKNTSNDILTRTLTCPQ